MLFYSLFDIFVILLFPLGNIQKNYCVSRLHGNLFKKMNLLFLLSARFSNLNKLLFTFIIKF